MATTYDLISSTTLTSSATDVTFSGITTAWTDLRLVTTLFGSGELRLQFNGNTSTDYSYTFMATSGSSAASSYGVNTSYLNFTYNGNSSTIPTLYTADIFGYSSNNYKGCLLTESASRGSGGGISKTVGLYRSGTVISSIKVYPSSTTLGVGTIMSLYGIKAA